MIVILMEVLISNRLRRVEDPTLPLAPIIARVLMWLADILELVNLDEDVLIRS